MNQIIEEQEDYEESPNVNKICGDCKSSKSNLSLSSQERWLNNEQRWKEQDRINKKKQKEYSALKGGMLKQKAGPSKII